MPPESTSIATVMIKNESGDLSRKKISGVIETSTREPLPLPVTGLILCGGRSKRMGRPKAFLPYGGSTIVEHLLATSRDIFNEVYLVTNEPDSFAHISDDVVKDILPYRGPLGGILSGLLVASNPHAFVIACDMPLVKMALIRQMAAQRHDTDVLVLAHKEGVEPLLGIYSKNCIKPLEESLFADQLKVHDFLQGLKAKLFRYDDSQVSGAELPPYYNVNTPQDYSTVLTKSPIYVQSNFQPKPASSARWAR